MHNETLFYICGGVLAASALIVTFAGLKLKDFPGKALPLVVVWFAVFVVGAGTFAVLHAKDEQEAKAAELEEAGREIEEGESVGGFENEGGALGGEREELEEEAEEEAEGSVQGEEPVGPTEGSQQGKGAQTPEPGSQGGEGGPEDGGASGTGSAGAATTLKLAADPAALAFDEDELTAKAGKVTIDFDNPSAIPHNVVIEKDGKELAGFEPITEGQKTLSADLDAGTYEFICSVPGHEPAGMKGTLIVE
jgi:plastocyanin